MIEEEEAGCEWCGWPFPPETREGLDRIECMDRSHEEAVCNACSSCLHYDHRGAA